MSGGERRKNDIQSPYTSNLLLNFLAFALHQCLLIMASESLGAWLLLCLHYLYSLLFPTEVLAIPIPVLGDQPAIKLNPTTLRFHDLIMLCDAIQ